MEALLAYGIAKVDSGLPSIMTMCTPAERRVVIQRVKSKIANGKWTGARIKRVRPVVRFLSHRARHQSFAGQRAVRKTGYPDGVSILAYHAILLAHGYYPTYRKNVCSHLCHNAGCVQIEHLTWSDANENDRRERMCRKSTTCKCGLQPSCILTGCKKM